MKQDWVGTKVVNNKTVCEVCGNNKFTPTMFMDGTNFYVQQGKCTECGNPISVKGTYEPDDEAYQEGEEEV